MKFGIGVSEIGTKAHFSYTLLSNSMKLNFNQTVVINDPLGQLFLFDFFNTDNMCKNSFTITVVRPCNLWLLKYKTEPYKLVKSCYCKYED